jgi:hypothetical protein
MNFHAQSPSVHVSGCRRYWLAVGSKGVDIKVVDPRTGRLMKRLDAGSLEEAMRMCRHREQRRRS